MLINSVLRLLTYTVSYQQQLQRSSRLICSRHSLDTHPIYEVIFLHRKKTRIRRRIILSLFSSQQRYGGNRSCPKRQHSASLARFDHLYQVLFFILQFITSTGSITSKYVSMKYKIFQRMIPFWRLNGSLLNLFGIFRQVFIAFSFNCLR